MFLNNQKDNSNDKHENKKLLLNKRGNNDSFKVHFRHFLLEIRALLSHPAAIMLIFAGGLESGINTSWSAVLQDMLRPIDLSDSLIGYIGFAVAVASMIGSMLMGPISDHFFRKRLKKLLLILLVGGILSFAVAFAMLPSPFWTYGLFIDELQHASQFQSRFVIVLCVAMCIGFFSGAMVPVFFEFVAEICYPVSEGSSGMCLVFCNSVMSLLIVGTGSWLNTRFETLLALTILLVCCFITLSVKEVYQRDAVGKSF
ncbi:hypothetical protein RFI_05885 [Reticulomyxa filosa]|uniref:Major facilitator superfamily (MFS) profile domain-containing protein n=1 Tax=Reticulomyxa filosa TaxID=46433 RepID=X6NZ39_RETFI|nr:hypothetical protein RFI_05885 [Reticulomyxa filosa]|eukprot:ETO31236.1 hypothetical protein RFI_05885 [Reticulomyxa filosa]